MKETFEKFKALKQGIGKERSLLAYRSVLKSFILKSIGIISNLLYVPVCIDYLDKERYGIWLTLSSIIGWISFFDLGLGNGLRNKLTEALAKKEINKAKEYISTSYFLFAIIFGVLIVSFLVINNFLDWAKLLNTTVVQKKEMNLAALIVFIFFSLRFIFLNITIVSFAKQQPFYGHLFTSVSSILALCIIILISKFSAGSLVVLVLVASSSQVVVLLMGSILLYSGRFKSISPSPKYINLKHTRTLLNFGLQFFIIQLTSIVLFSTANIIVTQLFGPSEVTTYNVAYKYFSLPIMIYSIIISPIWSASTDAFHKNDFAWLRKTLKFFNTVSFIFLFGILIMLLISTSFYQLWIGNRVIVPFKYSCIMAIWAIISVFLTPYSQIINGIGKLRISLILSILNIILYPILAIYFSHTFLKAVGIIFSTCIVNGISMYFQINQVNMLLNKKAYGIWNK